jgi:sulfoxide reductase heme-binding subunit YedZ
MYKLKALWLPILAHVTALMPLVLLVLDFTRGGLSANPIREIQLRTGQYALVLLVLSLASTPISAIFHLQQVRRLRRLLGLYAFSYVSLHFLNFLWLDYGFDFGLIREDIFEKWFAVVGFIAFLFLIPLAATSTRGWMKRLDKNWKRLHWLVFPAVVLAVAHFALQAKGDLQEPLVYGAVVVLFLILRLPAFRKVLSKLIPSRG